MNELIPVTRKGLEGTPLSNISLWVVYRLCRDGQLAHVKIGRRVYLTAGTILAFVMKGGER